MEGPLIEVKLTETSFSMDFWASLCSIGLPSRKFVLHKINRTNGSLYF